MTVKKGYCNCKHDVIRYASKTKEYKIDIVRDSFEEVRVDKNGLCFLCANVALKTKPVRRNDRTLEFERDKYGDLTVGHGNKDGIFKERVDESHLWEVPKPRGKYGKQEKKFSISREWKVALMYGV
jgi:hypothetical protein